MNNHRKKLSPNIVFRIAKKKELSQIIALFSDSFKNDPLMHLFNPRGKNQKVFIHNLFSVNTKAYFRKHLCFVATIENEIVAAALVKKKNVTVINFFDYAISGGWSLIANLGLKSFIKFLSVYDCAQKDCKDKYANFWYIDSIAVKGSRQGKGIGRSMIQQCIIPYIQKNGGGMLTLITQNINNYDFYVKNGFLNFSSNPLINDTFEICNYSFSQFIATNDSSK